MTVIVTDHHSLAKLEDGRSILPDADAINPWQTDCQYPFPNLWGLP